MKTHSGDKNFPIQTINAELFSNARIPGEDSECYKLEHFNNGYVKLVDAASHIFPVAEVVNDCIMMLVFDRSVRLNVTSDQVTAENAPELWKQATIYSKALSDRTSTINPSFTMFDYSAESIMRWGIHKQVVKLVEELFELNAALTTYAFSLESHEGESAVSKKVISEMCDVEAVLPHLSLIMGLDYTPPSLDRPHLHITFPKLNLTEVMLANTDLIKKILIRIDKNPQIFVEGSADEPLSSAFKLVVEHIYMLRNCFDPDQVYAIRLGKMGRFAEYLGEPYISHISKLRESHYGKTER